jgi:hypothetical protein
MHRLAEVRGASTILPASFASCAAEISFARRTWRRRQPSLPPWELRNSAQAAFRSFSQLEMIKYSFFSFPSMRIMHRKYCAETLQEAIPVVTDRSGGCVRLESAKPGTCVTLATFPIFFNGILPISVGNWAPGPGHWHGLPKG